MRFFIVFAIVSSMIYLSNGQQPMFNNQGSFQDPSINPFVNPSFSSNRPNSFSPQFAPNQSPTTVGSTLSRILGWFRRSRKQNNELDSPNNSIQSESINFSNSLPKESTDRMISDAIADRILEESREQQTIVGSPFIKDDSVVDYETNASENDVAIDREGYGKSVANAPTDTIPLVEALRIVNTSNLSDCVARVICELSCNANSYGPQGRIVFRNLIKLQFDQSIKGEDAKFFRQAAAKGRQIVQGKRDCSECFSIYSSCRSSSKDLVAVSSMFKL